MTMRKKSWPFAPGNELLRAERDLLKKAAAYFAKETKSIPNQIIDAKKAEHKILVSCKLLGVSPSGYFAGRSAAVKGAGFAAIGSLWRMSGSAFL